MRYMYRGVVRGVVTDDRLGAFVSNFAHMTVIGEVMTKGQVKGDKRREYNKETLRAFFSGW